MDKKILFVDDDPDALYLHKIMALHHGFTPCCARNAAEALQIMASENIRVFCIDLTLPDMDGFELYRRIKEFNPRACVYALSGEDAGRVADKLQAAGFDGFFQKPTDWQALLDTFRKAFELIDQRGKEL